MDSSNSILEEEIQAAEEIKAVDNSMIGMDEPFYKSRILCFSSFATPENDLLAT